MRWKKTGKSLVSGEDGRRTVELFTAIYRSTQINALIVVSALII